jgi:translation initiation factor 3 subunit G
MAEVAALRPTKRWGDEESEDEGLPPRQEFGPDEDGVRTIVDFSKNERGDLVKTTTRVRTVREETRLYDSVKARRNCPPFGEAKDRADNRLYTAQSKEDIPFERTNLAMKTDAERTMDEMQGKLGAINSKQAVVSNLKELLAKKRLERQLLAASGQLPLGDLPPEDGGAVAMPGEGKFVPVHLRGGKTAAMLDADLKRQRDECTIRISNLSTETDSDDLKALCAPFGSVQRAHIAQDKLTGESRGFGFVSFFTKSAAQAAIDKLHGYGYDFLVLNVDWADREKQRPR